MMGALRIKSLLVPTDFSAAAGRALEYARDVADVTGARITVLHVIAPVHYVETVDLALLMREAEESARTALAQIEPPPAVVMIEHGVPHQVIVQVAESIGADLIVIGTHGRSGLKRLMLGSVAENVVRHASCPVFTVRSEAEQDSVTSAS